MLRVEGIKKVNHCDSEVEDKKIRSHCDSNEVEDKKIRSHCGSNEVEIRK
jgi:hypothetical protein